MQKPEFVKDQIYHIYNRGVEERKVFIQPKDSLRFIHDLFEFNDEAPATNVSYHLNPQSMEVKPRYFQERRKPRELLVEILAFVLMPNHFHLLLRQLRENGIVRFMQKLGTGYTMFFNKKYERVGSLFQGSFKAVLVEDEPHFLYLPFYIHSNPLELMPIYRGLTSINWREGMRFLEEYRWSSFPDYIGKKNFPSVTSREFLLEVFGGESGMRKKMESQLKDKIGSIAKLNEIQEFLFDYQG